MRTSRVDFNHTLAMKRRTRLSKKQQHRVFKWSHLVFVLIAFWLIALWHFALVPAFRCPPSEQMYENRHDVATTTNGNSNDQLHLDLVYDIELVSVLGNGYVNLGFEVKIPKLGDESYVMKIGSQDFLYYTANEMKAFRILNEQPSTPSIPKLLWSCEVMNNPFRTWDDEILDVGLNRSGVSKEQRHWLFKQKAISVQILSFIPYMVQPEGLSEISPFMRSVLQALDFAHSRNVINGDIRRRNVRYDNRTGIAHLFDWDQSRIFVPNATTRSPHLHSPTPEDSKTGWRLMHATVSSFDIFTTGQMLSMLLCERGKCKDVPPRTKANERLWLALDMASQMLMEDPYKRPSARELLKHAFVS